MINFAIFLVLKFLCRDVIQKLLNYMKQNLVSPKYLHSLFLKISCVITVTSHQCVQVSPSPGNLAINETVIKLHMNKGLVKSPGVWGVFSFLFPVGPFWPVCLFLPFCIGVYFIFLFCSCLFLCIWPFFFPFLERGPQRIPQELN